MDINQILQNRIKNAVIMKRAARKNNQREQIKIWTSIEKELRIVIKSANTDGGF